MDFLRYKIIQNKLKISEKKAWVLAASMVKVY